MRVSLITDGIYPFVVGGMQKHSFYLAKHLAASGCDVDLYHFRNHNSSRSLEEIFGEGFSRINFIELQFPQSKRLPLHYLRESKEYSRKLFEAYRNRPPSDIIICKGFTGYEFIRQKNKGVSLAPVCINFHGYEMYQKAFTIKERIIQKLLRPLVKYITVNADYVFSYGGKITDILKSQLHISANKILEFPSGIEKTFVTDVNEPEKNTVRFCFVGRNERRKGLQELNAALQLLSEKKSWTFDFVGPIENEAMLLADNIKYHGQLTDEQSIFNVLRQCDVMVVPSWSEGMPNVILEAMSCGLAILATDTGATNLLVNEENGWLIQEPKPETIYSSLSKIINASPEEIVRKKRASLIKIQNNFLWSNIAQQIKQELQSKTVHA